MEISSIFQIKPYWLHGWPKYPTCANKRLPHRYFQTREEAVAEIQKFVAANSFRQHRIYCIVLSELPLGIPMYESDSFSEQLFLPDGTLWSERAYAQMMVIHDVPPQYTEAEYDRYMYGRCAFYGRKPEDIRFQRGDIIEIFCHEGCEYWMGNGQVELAMVVDTPPTIDEMTNRINLYLNEDPSPTDDRELYIGMRFNHRHDAYTVIPACHSLHEEPKEIIDFCPTHCAFAPRQKVSAKMRNKLAKQLERVSQLKKSKIELLNL